MAIEFDDASTEYLSASSLIVSPPFSVSAWFRCDDDSSAQRVFALYGNLGHKHECRIDPGPLRTISAVSSTITAAEATTGNSWSVDNWHHGLWTLETNRRTVTLNGGTTAVDTTGRSPTVTNTGVGGPTLLLSGCVAELAVWDSYILGIDEWETVKAGLAAGFSPLAVYPTNLVAWLRFIHGEIHDVIGGFVLTPHGSPTSAAHPRVWDKRGGRRILTPAASSAPSRIVSLGGVYANAGGRIVLVG